jgi:hypothetical protein
LQKSEKTTKKKKCFKLSDVMVGSEIREKPIPDPGSGGQKGTGSRIRNTEQELYIKTPAAFSKIRKISELVRFFKNCFRVN